MDTQMRLHVATSRCAVSCTSCQVNITAEVPLSAFSVAQRSGWLAGAVLRHRFIDEEALNDKAGWAFFDLSVTCVVDQGRGQSG